MHTPRRLTRERVSLIAKVMRKDKLRDEPRSNFAALADLTGSNRAKSCRTTC
jgi:hypothetical protein